MKHFFLNDAATPEIFTLSLHDALPIFASLPLLRPAVRGRRGRLGFPRWRGLVRRVGNPRDRKSTRLNSSHVSISYTVFCLKKKTNFSTARFIMPNFTLSPGLTRQMLS